MKGGAFKLKFAIKMSPQTDLLPTIFRLRNVERFGKQSGSAGRINEPRRCDALTRYGLAPHHPIPQRVNL